MTKYKLLGIGTPVMDVFYEADYEFVKKHGLQIGCTNHLSDEQVSAIERELKPILESAGDNARNVCESFVKSGGEKCAYFGNVSDDETGGKIRENIKKNGILDLMANLNGKTGRIMCIITPDKQRTFAVYLGVGEKKVEFGNIEIPEIFFCTSITFFCKGIGDSSLEFAKKCKEGDGKIAISLESENLLKENLDRIPQICGLADYLFLNEDEMRAIGKNEGNVGSLAPVVFLKRGALGSVVYEKGEILGVVEAKKVEVKDTTGAGDFFAGAALRAISKGEDLLAAAKAGNEMAAKIISKIGAGL